MRRATKQSFGRSVLDFSAAVSTASPASTQSVSFIPLHVSSSITIVTHHIDHSESLYQWPLLIQSSHEGTRVSSTSLIWTRGNLPGKYYCISTPRFTSLYFYHSQLYLYDTFKDTEICIDRQAASSVQSTVDTVTGSSREGHRSPFLYDAGQVDGLD